MLRCIIHGSKDIFMEQIQTLNLYRMPWSMSDNPLSWIEPTRECDLSCEYCYQKNDPLNHKSLEEFEMDLKGLLSLRNFESLHIAGGEPLIHPQIVEMIKLVRKYGLKPIILTNGNSLTEKLLKELKRAGAYGLIFHIDSLQNRPGWTGKNEIELNELRQKYADMLYKEKGLICGFNTVVIPKMINQVEYIMKWTLDNIDKVSVHVFMPVRIAPVENNFEYFAGNKKIEIAKIGYSKNFDEYRALSAQEIFDQIQKVIPNFTFSSYLGGTMISTAPKWLFANIIASKKILYGYIGSKGMNIIQSFSHILRNKYLAYLKPRYYKHAKLLYWLFPFDKIIRKALFKNILSVFSNPLRLFEKTYLQMVLVLQPQDFLPNGEQDLCDGCPNKTYFIGRLVSECRMEDYLNYGRMIQSVRKEE
jgi:pyruvate-formate lyase-activating enzyme